MIVDCAVYEDGRAPRRSARRSSEAFEACHEPTTRFVWIGLYEPTEDEFDSVRREFHLHELAVEDAIHAHQRPKLEVYGDTIFIVLKTARYVDAEEVVEFGEILIFIGEGFIITVRHGEATRPARRARSTSSSGPSCCARGPGAVLHAIVDRVVDDYVPGARGPRAGHRGGRGGGLLDRPRPTRPSASTSSSARCSSSSRGRAARRAGRPARRGPLRADPPRGAGPTSAT